MKMKRKIIGILTSSALLVGMLGTAASAQDELLWQPEDVIAEDSEHVVVYSSDRPAQEADILLEGPADLEIDEVGEYTVTVSNLSDKYDLSSWKLGFGVANIASVDDITIRYADGGPDLTGGTPGVDVSLVDNVLYLRGSGDPVIPVGGSPHVSLFEVQFHTDGLFTGAAYVIDEAKSLYVAPDQPDYYPYYSVTGGINPNDPPMNPRGIPNDDLPDSYQCSLNRVGSRVAEGEPIARSDNWVLCYDHEDGSLFYWHYIVMVEESDPLWPTLAARGAVVSDLGLITQGVPTERRWRLASFNAFDGQQVHSIDTTDRGAIEQWAAFPVPADDTP